MNDPVRPGRAARVTGLALSILVILFLALDAGAKLARVAPVIEGTVRLGYSESIIRPLGVILLACTLLYAFPRTSLLGALLLTGYLGGAVATHARIDNPLATHTLFPIYVAVLLWLGLLLRDRRLRALTTAAWSVPSGGCPIPPQHETP